MTELEDDMTIARLELLTSGTIVYGTEGMLKLNRVGGGFGV